jgi:diguanylate cyclase (GGDEF)-like protein
MRFEETIKSFYDRHAIEHKNSILKHMANKDNLTNLYTNKYMFEHLEYELARSNRYDFPLSLMFIDVDNFKQVNETYGQVLGDDLLTTVANIISSLSRDTDIPGRYSGKKFMLILPNTSLDDSIIVAERIRVTIEKNDFSVDMPITVSIGLKTYNGTNSKTYIKGVELLLQEAKLGGKNRIQY